jgi:hypothetical protein
VENLLDVNKREELLSPHSSSMKEIQGIKIERIKKVNTIIGKGNVKESKVQYEELIISPLEPTPITKTSKEEKIFAALQRRIFTK